jgi:diguanylate cyclase
VADQPAVASPARARRWPGTPGPLPDRVDLAIGAAFVAYAVLYSVVNRLAGNLPWVRALTYEGLAVPLAVCCACAAIMARTARLPRALLAAAAVATAAADVAWDLDALGALSIESVPVVSALMYLPAYLCLFAAVVVSSARWGDGRVATTLETVIVASGAAVAGYPYLISPYVDGARTDGEVALGILSPVGDLLVLTSIALLLPRMRGSRVMWVLSGGMLAWLVADHAYRQQLEAGTYHPGGWVDVLWLLFYAALAMAMRVSAWPTARRAEPRLRTSPLKVVALGAAALSAPVWLAYAETHLDAQRAGEVRLPLSLASIVIVTLVMLRLTLLLHAHSTTTERLNVTVGERERLTESLQHQALHDSLTGLPNRAHLIAAAARIESEHDAVLVFIDLDDFKNVNDTLGHEVGDGLLQVVADRLRSHIRAGDIVARLGGDEFAILMPGLSTVDARRRVERILDVLAAPVEIAGSKLTLTASIGVSPMSGSYTEALAAADMAMYAGKKAGKGQVRIYDESIAQQVLGDAALAVDLRRAIDEDSLSLAYQPVVSLHDGTVTGCEALLRWTHPTLGPLLPGTFLAVGEERGMGTDLDRWVVRAAARQMARWQASGFRMRVNVNASAAYIAEPTFVPEILRALETFGVPGEQLTIEVTEQGLLSDLSGAAAKLRELRAHGVRVALDDFGTGYSGLAYLQELPVDVLKLDKSFVRVDEAGVPDGPLLAVVVGLGRALGMRVLAEGIESTVQESTLRSLGCDAGQGWRWTKALEPDAFRAWTAQWSAPWSAEHAVERVPVARGS